jgi:predicted DNA-binding transcriptional regulator AlpA
VTDRLLNVFEVAAILGVATGTVYHMVSRLPVVRLSARCLRFQESAIRRLIEALAEEARAKARR